jgi:UDP-hydrolysing UDP-N-acetyl-D-glucosamine 2-epimerase
MKEIGVLTTSRADFGFYQPILDRIRRSRSLRARIIASGSHLEPDFGLTVREIEAEGYAVFRKVRCLKPSMARSMAAMIEGLGRVFERWVPDLLLVLGDRFEMLAGALAAVAAHLPIAHIHGGEITAGALDDSFRHALSKLAHLHFVATPEAAGRLRQMGEEPWRIVVSGAPILDRLASWKPVPLELPESFLLVTYHPVTLEPGHEGRHASALVAALRRLGLPCIVTAPNADPGSQRLRRELLRFCRDDPASRFVESAGTRLYFTFMSRARAMLGNSSSGLLEAPSFRLPVVNIGSRQDGRLRAANVIDCGNATSQIVRATRRALSPSFRKSIRGLVNPYGDGCAAERVVKRLESLSSDGRLLQKGFVSWP